MARLLFLVPGPAPPPSRAALSKFCHIGGHLVDVIVPTWFSSEEGFRRHFPNSRFPLVDLGLARYWIVLLFRVPRVLRKVVRAWSYVSSGVRLNRRGKGFDAIICYGANSVGLAGLLLSILLQRPLFLEIPGVPTKAFVLDRERPGAGSQVKRIMSLAVLRLILLRCAGVCMRYPDQVPETWLRRVPNRVVSHGFVPVSQIAGRGSKTSEPYVLLMGTPWYLKGADILVRAFVIASAKIPDMRLRIVGYNPEPQRLRMMAGDDTRVSIEPAVSRDEAIRLIQGCSIFVLASRTEAIARVMLEAMACERPVIAAEVDGIPFYAKHECNALLFRPTDAAALADCLVRLWTDPVLARRLGRQAKRDVMERWNEQSHADAWGRLLAGYGIRQ